MRPYVLALGIAVLALGLVGWNVSRFIGAEAKIRTKDLSFLPSPAVGRLLALGHTNTAAKLRWIDSFAFFELQLERRDDTVAATGESAFLRLYQLLIDLDGHFLPYYDHSTLNLGGIQSRHQDVLSLLQLGILNQPHDPQLWRLLAVELYTAFHFEEKQPHAFNAILDQWHEAMEDPQQAQQVWDWKVNFGRRREQGLDQIPYWMSQLGTAQGPTREFILQTVREQISLYGAARLTSLVARFKAARGFVPVALADVVRPEWMRLEWPAGLPGEAPIKVLPGAGLVLRPDAYGQPYRLQADGTVVSDGVAQFRFGGRVAQAEVALEKAATTLGHWPASLAEVTAAGVALQEPPAGGVWRLDGKSLVVDWPPAPERPWSP